MNEPYISIVVATRNDNHSGNMIERLQSFIDTWVDQANLNKLTSEIIIVEWNPPQGRPLIENLIKKPSSSYCDIAVVTVPFEEHKKITNSDKIVFFQMIAKNIGIYKAKGQFILATNVDIFFSNELVTFLASKRLSSGKFYRADRSDVLESGFPFNGSLNDKIKFASENIVRVNRRTKTQVRGKSESKMEKWNRFISVAYGTVKWGTFLHTNGCGDFTLMSNQNWKKIKGYPEFPIYSIYLDGLACYAAHYTGIRESVLKYKVFHVDHSESWAVNDHFNNDLIQLSYKKYMDIIQKMRKDITTYYETTIGDIL